MTFWLLGTGCGKTQDADLSINNQQMADASAFTNVMDMMLMDMMPTILEHTGVDYPTELRCRYSCKVNEPGAWS